MAKEKFDRSKPHMNIGGIGIDIPDTLVEHSRESFYLNRRLLNRMSAWSNLDHLIQTHKQKLDIFDQMDKEDDIKKLNKLAEEVTQLEFQLQRLWGFPEDRTFHEWYKVPRCTCPKLDNMDARGTKYTTINCGCLVHGQIPIGE